MGAPISTPTAAVDQLMPSRAPMTSRLGLSVGWAVLAAGAVTMTPERKPQATVQATMPAAEPTAVQLSSSTMPTAFQNMRIRTGVVPTAPPPPLGR